MTVIKKLFKDKKNSLFIPYLIFFVLFILVPLSIVIVSSFIPIEGGNPGNSTEVISSPSFWVVFGRSVLISIITAFACLLISMPYVYLTTQVKNKALKVTLILLLVSPLAVFTLVKILALRGFFTFIFDERQLNNSVFLTIGLIYLNLPFMVIPLYGVFNSMPKNLINASEDLGYNKIQTFIKVVLPYGIKAICSGFTMVFILSAMSVAVSDKLLINPDQNETVGNIIVDLTNPNNIFDMQKASSVILITLIIMGAIFLLINSIPYFYRKRKGGIDE